MRRRRLDGEHLAGTRTLADALRAVPVLRHQEQGSPIRATEHAGEAAAVEIDPLQHLAALGDADATLVRDVGVPDGCLRVDADPVRDTVAEIGPGPAAREAAVSADLESRELLAVGVRD